MKLINPHFIHFMLIFNLWFYLETFDKIDCFLVKKSTFSVDSFFNFLNPAIVELSDGFAPQDSKPVRQNSPTSLLPKNVQPIEKLYFVFAIAIAVIAIGLELVLAKRSISLQQTNNALLMRHKTMAVKNASLEKQLMNLEDNNEENSKLLQVVAHDLRSPMAAIVGLSGFMIDEHNLVAEDMEVISLIHTSGVDSLKFINEILERESIKLEIKKEDVDLHQLLKYCIAQLQYKAAEKQQTINLMAETVPILRLNREQIWRVICNLITNALKFSPHQSEVHIALKSANNKLTISVGDQGIGIPVDLREKIFSACGQQKRAGTDGEKSFGLGLLNAKQLVEAHGGMLTFESEVGKGTTFVISLPIG
jgi:signal transduction histidine kinase